MRWWEPSGSHHLGSVVVVGRGERGRFLRTEPDDLLAAPESHRVVDDRVGDVEAGSAVEDVRLVVVRERVQHVPSRPAVLDVGTGARPDDVVAVAGVDDVAAFVRPDGVVPSAAVDQIRPGQKAVRGS